MNPIQVILSLKSHDLPESLDVRTICKNLDWFYEYQNFH